MRAGYSEVYTTYENGRYPPAPGKTWNDSLLDMPGEETEMSPSVPYLRFPKHLKGWVGGEKGFDPLGVSDALPVYHLREAELKHGRVCMLATIGWIATDLGFRFSGEIYQGVGPVEAHNAMIKAGQMQPLLGAVFVAELYSFWLILEGFGGSIERASGDYFLGKSFLPKEQEAEKQMKLKELENGRLAMLAFSGIVTTAVATGKPWPFL
jgi:light-harvesting complex I chlorophyll a/b binding protein 1